VERVYDELLQGEPGSVEYRVRRGEIIEQRPPEEPVAGSSLVLNIDLALQEQVELALENGVALSNEVKEEAREDGEEVFSETQRAAAVVLDANTFDVLALASFPDFDPGLFVAGIDKTTFDGLNEAKAFNNLAVSGLYPPASTFKAITYTAKLEENLPFPTDVEGIDGELINCDGTLVLDELADGSPQEKHDWYDPRELGWLDIHGALENSCNIYFWNVALGTYQAYNGKANENILQDWASRLGYGHETGIDLTSEASGIIPTRQLFEEWKAYQLENPDEPPRLEPSRLELASPWLGGDLMDFAIGQGAFTSTPLHGLVVCRPYQRRHDPSATCGEGDHRPGRGKATGGPARPGQGRYRPGDTGLFARRPWQCRERRHCCGRLQRLRRWGGEHRWQDRDRPIVGHT
jgi:penicillin-binding protein 2